MLDHFKKQGKASFILGGQFGSEAKGAASAFVATHLRDRSESFDIVTANNGAQSGHVSIHDGKSLTLFHLPTAAAYPQMYADGQRRKFQPLTYLNGGAIIDVDVLLDELERAPTIADKFRIHPNAAVITPQCREYEMRNDSAQTKVASTRKGVGQALAYKVLRSGLVAKDEPRLARWIGRLDLNDMMLRGASVLVEVPQGHSLSLDGPFYPHTTSRNCTVAQAMSDAGIHPHFYHQSMMVIRTFPIRVGNIISQHDTALGPSNHVNSSGSHFPDQREISWGDLGVAAEITTVTKRVRRVFTFSEQQVAEAIAQTRPAVIYLTFCDYLPGSFTIAEGPGATAGDSISLQEAGQRATARLMVDRLREMCNRIGSVRHDGPEVLTQWGPTTVDVIRAEDI